MTVPGTYWLYAGVSLLTIVFAVFFLPETKDKRLDEITEVFKAKKVEEDGAE